MLKLIVIALSLAMTAATMREQVIDPKKLRGLRVQLHENLKWKSCGHDDDALHLHKLEFYPRTISFPQTMRADYHVDVNEHVEGPIWLDIKMKRKIFFLWVTVPCLKNFGSCGFDDFCPILEGFKNEFGLPFDCPIEEMEAKMGNVTFDLPHMSHDALVKGQYYARIKASNEYMKIGCIEIYFDVV